MRELVLVRGRQVRAHGAVVAGDDDAAAARRLVGRYEVFRAHACFFVLRPQRRGVFVRAHAPDVERAVWREDVLRGWGAVSFAVRCALGGGEGTKGGGCTCAPRVVFCAAPPAMSFALWFWSRSS